MTRDIAFMRKVLHSSAANYDNVGHLVTFDLDLPWISREISPESDPEWLLIDLGAVSSLQELHILWGESAARSFAAEASLDEVCWTKLTEGAGIPGGETVLPLQGKGRFVRLLLNDCSGDHYVIRKVRILGENELPADSNTADCTAATSVKSGAASLSNWKVKRASNVNKDGAALSLEDFDDTDWLSATVPGTVLTSYLKAGCVADPFFDDDQFQISEAYFTADFWYRASFAVPMEQQGKRVFLNFDSINWKADIFVNGTFLPNALPGRTHSMEGAFIRGKFDITDLVCYERENHLAVLIHKNDTPGEVTTQGLAFGPGPNGGKLGADNPTLHASVGWDWLPTIRGRNIGIIGDVSLSFAGDALLIDPWMETKLELLSETTALPMKDLMLSEKVQTAESIRDWHGHEGDALTIDLGQEETIGAVTAEWGTEAGGAAADLESRYPEAFRLETSLDGLNWQNLNAYPGGEVEVMFFGALKAEPQKGSDQLEGHAISDTLPGATAIVSLDLTRFGMGIVQREIVTPMKARYLRFTVLKQRSLSGKKVDTIIHQLHVYQETPTQLEQGIKHTYKLNTEKSDLTFRGEVKNLSKEPKEITLQGRILPDGVTFESTMTVASGQTLEVQIPAVLPSPKLWWPNTYGDPYLYEAEITLLSEGMISDTKNLKFGVRRFDYPIEGGLLSLYCNGVRIVAKGGNWGIDDGLKQDDAKRLDDKVRLHAKANMNMIRNWIGMTSHPGFYEACDKYGVLIWDDFWLANPVDGPNPNDEEMFLQNAADKIRSVRSHAALCFYCGRNEGNPPESIDQGLNDLTKQLDGTRIYFPHSAAAPVGSGGGYSLARSGEKYGVKQYFNDVTSSVLRSERGIPNVPELCSVKKFVRPEHMWPISEVWALHDWTYHMNGPANTYMEALQNYLGGDFEVPVDHVQGQAPSETDPVFIAYKAAIAKMCREAGEAWTMEDFFKAASLISYDHHRGLFDALGSKLSGGLLMWMSQSSWPSFMWQTYDYFLNVNGGYFGAKSGCAPTKAIFDPRNDSVLAVNASPCCFENAKVKTELFDLKGCLVSEKTYDVPLLDADAYAVYVGQVDFAPSATDLVFLRLSLTDKEGNVLSSDLYWHNRREYQNYKALKDLPKAQLKIEELNREINGSTVLCRLKVTNGPAPALGVRISLTDENILPVFYSDNYLMMMPGDERSVTAEFRWTGDTENLAWQLSGWNL